MLNKVKTQPVELDNEDNLTIEKNENNLNNDENPKNEKNNKNEYVSTFRMHGLVSHTLP